MKIIDSPSPNQNDRPPGVRPYVIVIHGTVGSDAADLSWTRTAQSQISYHYLLLRNGTIHRLVPPERRAWHAGSSSWRGRPNVNDYSIGIGLSNKGPGEEFTPAQYQAAGWLVATLRRHWPVQYHDIVGHCHISPVRKTDPWLHFRFGEFFAHVLKEEGKL
jgi:N-acetyl-anhydromuramyl-L-alanine amidase AmpD